MEPLRIFGAGVAGHLVGDLVRWQLSDRYFVDGYYDDARTPGSAGPGGIRVIGTVAQGVEDIAGGEAVPFVALGTLARAAACRLLVRLRERRVEPVSLVAGDAHVSPSAQLGPNALVFPGAVIGAEVTAGALLTALPGSILEHHGRVGDDVVVASGATIAGFVRLSSHSFVGLGASVLPGSDVGTGSLLGGGSTLVSQLPAHSVAFGSPARVVRETRKGDETPTREEIAAIELDGFPAAHP